MKDQRAELEANLKTLDETLKGPRGGEFGLSGSEVTGLLRERRITVSALAALGSEKPGGVTDRVKKQREKREASLIAKSS